MAYYLSALRASIARVRREAPTSNLTAYLALVVGILSLSFTGLFVRWANAPGPVSSFYRMVIAVVLMAWPFWRRVKTSGFPPRRAVWLALLGGLVFAGDLAFWSTGVMIGGVANPTLLTNAAPLWVALGAWVLFREKLGVKFWIGMALAAIGVIILLGLDSSQSASLGLGSLFGLIGGVFYGGYFLITQRGRESLDALSYFWLAALSSGLGLLAVALVLGQPLSGYPAYTYLNILGLGVIAQVAGYLSINYALGRLPASRVAPLMFSQPVFTALLAVPLAGEPLTAGQIIGGTAVLVGVYIVQRSRSS